MSKSKSKFEPHFTSIDELDPEVVAAAKKAYDEHHNAALSAQFTTGDGRPTTFLTVSKAVCEVCKGATGGTAMGITHESGDSVTLECTNGRCGQVISTLRSLLPK